MRDIRLLHAVVTDPRLRALELQSALSELDAARIGRLVRPQDRALAITGWGLLRILLARETGREPGDVEFRTNAYGKPFLDAGPHFNMAHSGGAVLIGLADGGRLGVDLEAYRAVRDLDTLVEQNFAEEERAEFRALRDSEREAAFFRGWTRKEALVKAVGKGLSTPLDSFAVSLAPGWEPALLRADPSEVGHGPWDVRSVPVPGHVEAAIACEGGPSRVIWIDLADLSS